MFIKPYKLKSNTPLKGSETKKLRQRLEKEFPNATIDLLVSSKANVSLLKIYTHSEFQTIVYCVDKLPMFFEYEGGGLAPTLYTLWQKPDLLPYFTTLDAVLPKLANGADLMLPGVIPQGTGMNIYGRFKKGQLVAVNLTSNLAAVGVGYLARSSDDLYMAGRYGVAVKMLHLFGDKLWSLEPSLTQQVPNMKPKKLTASDFPELGADPKKNEKQASVLKGNPQTMANVVAQKIEKVIANDIVPAVETLNIMENINENNDTAGDTTKTNSNGTIESTPEDILKNAFLAALKNHGKTLQLPLLTSTFYRNFVVPEATEQVDLKKTKYKKLSHFLTEMIDQGFIVVREEAKGVDKITAIDLDHPEIVNFITDFKATTNAEEGEDKPLFHSELKELYIVTDSVAPFFTKMNYKRGEGIPATQIKKIIREYISKHNLPIGNHLTKAYLLDETLAQICECKEATLSKISNDITSEMDHSYQMQTGSGINTNKPFIQMSLATRSGNKKVTLVSNVECYGIIMSEFIKLCKEGAAASTTIVKMRNQKSEQLQIQGNQVRFVYNLLTQKYKIPPKCILGLELARDAKKNKK